MTDTEKKAVKDFIDHLPKDQVSETLLKMIEEMNESVEKLHEEVAFIKKEAENYKENRKKSA